MLKNNKKWIGFSYRISVINLIENTFLIFNKNNNIFLCVGKKHLMIYICELLNLKPKQNR
ncbi:MAG: hypothetical protein BWX96_00135 [Bacteroidetes bacterium ADurb.Bin145]|nr:MAG: hypothetical protein BWX96_00135 [Bacteroidetes bacterium ADurb.Bin145]